MRVTANITIDDLWKDYIYLIFKVPNLKRNFLINTIIGPPVLLLILLIAVNFILPPMPIQYIVIGFILGGAAVDVILFYSLKKRVLKLMKTIQGDHTFEITDSGFYDIVAAGNCFRNWESVCDINRDKEYIYFFLQIDSLAIPLRAFESEDAAEKFYNKMMEYWKAARNVTA